MRNRRIFPATWPSTSWPLSSCTRNIAFGSASTTSPSNSTFSSLATDQMVRTLVACGPLAVSPSSYSTFEPSVSVRKPSPAIPEKWTNASLPPSSGVMKPKPFSSLNHFTTPVAIQHLLTTVPMREVVLPGTAFPHASRPLVTAATTHGFIPVWAAPGQTRNRPADQPGGDCAVSPCGADSYWVGSNPPVAGALGSAAVSGVVVESVSVVDGSVVDGSVVDGAVGWVGVVGNVGVVVGA